MTAGTLDHPTRTAYPTRHRSARVVVVGIDPGARQTGIVCLDLTETPGIGVAPLLATTTIARLDDDPPEQISREYLGAVLDVVCAMVADHRAKVIGVEDVTKPRGFAGGRRHTIDPAGILGAANVLGAVLGRDWPAQVRRVRPAGNGRLLPLDRYPGRLAVTGKGRDRYRHERSAYDVALLARQSPDAGTLAP